MSTVVVNRIVNRIVLILVPFFGKLSRRVDFRPVDKQRKIVDFMSHEAERYYCVV